jgi:hypothetical protein
MVPEVQPGSEDEANVTRSLSFFSEGSVSGLLQQEENCRFVGILIGESPETGE